MNGLIGIFVLWFHAVPNYDVEPDTVRMMFAGDVTLAASVEQMIGNDTAYIFAKWQTPYPLDIFMVNLENPVTTAAVKMEKEFNFRMKPVHLGTLRSGGINIVNCANNHVHDYGTEGMLETMKNIDSAGIARIGIGKNIKEARTPNIFTVKGKRIGFLGYSGWSFPAGKNRVGVAYRSVDLVTEDVKKLKPTVDIVIVNFHWGDELAELPNSSQIALAHAVIDAGADLIVGHHPHVLQGIEVYKGKTIAYSLGNFVFGGNSRNTYETAVLAADIIGGELRTSIVPVSVKKYQPQIADTAARTRTLGLVQRRSKQFRKTISFN